MKLKTVCTGFENKGICSMCGGELPKMLKTKIVEVLRGYLPSSQDTETLEEAADKIIMVAFPEFIEAVKVWIETYLEGK